MIQDILPRYQETADGIKTEFTPPFDLLDSDYIIVYVDDTRLSTGYSVVSNKIVFTTAPVADSLVTIQRVLPIEWTNENYGSIDKEVFSNILTNLVAQMQTLKEAVDRAVKTEPYDRDDGGSMSKDFIRQMRDALDILDEIERLAPSLVALKNEIDTYIEDASDAVVAYINNLTSDDIAEFSQLADQKLLQLQTIISTISTDTTLGGNSASDSITSSQKAIKTYVDGKVSNLQGQIDVKANDSAVVHNTGTETITGAKTFTADTKVSKTSPKLDLYNTNLTKGTTPSTLQFARTALLDKDGKLIAITQYQYDAIGSINAMLRAYNPNNETNFAQIGVVYPASGSAYTYALTPTNAYTETNGTQIANTGWVASGFVNLNYGQTITGSKTFTSYIKEQRSNPQVELINTDVTTGTSKNYDQPWWLRFEDTNGRTMGAIRSAYLKNSTNMVVYMRAIKSGASSDTDFADLSIHYPSTGNPFAEAPASDVNGSILTTVNKSKSSNGYFQLGNGMVVQWGRVTGITSNTETTVTFPKAFSSSTSYTIVKNYQSNSATEAADREISFYSMTATSAKTFTASTDTNSFSWLAIGY